MTGMGGVRLSWLNSIWLVWRSSDGAFCHDGIVIALTDGRSTSRKPSSHGTDSPAYGRSACAVCDTRWGSAHGVVARLARDCTDMCPSCANMPPFAQCASASLVIQRFTHVCRIRLVQSLPPLEDHFVICHLGLVPELYTQLSHNGH